MRADVRTILDQALALPESERRAIVEELAASLGDEPSELSTAWTGEVEARIGALERGEVDPVPWVDVEARIAQTLAGA